MRSLTTQQAAKTRQSVGERSSATTTGFANTAAGGLALFGNTTGSENTAIGYDALGVNTTGSGNTATGNYALLFNTSGSFNTATGGAALYSNGTGNSNTATGGGALSLNSTGSDNTANGVQALAFNTTGSNNTANGVSALFSNITGRNNTANGYQALLGNTDGNSNTANGVDALVNNITGSLNTVNGFNALPNNTTGSGNIALGYGAGANLTIGDHNIDIGNRGVADEANTIRIGAAGMHSATFVAGISGAIVPGGVGVIIGNNGKLGTVVSSERFKANIQPMDKTSDAILALKPVTFRYKHDLDPEGIPQFGLVAEEVEKVNPDLVTRDEQGKPYSVRYEAVNAMLLNEFLKEHCRVAQLEKQVAALTAGLQKVSAQLEVSKSAPRTALNNQ